LEEEKRKLWIFRKDFQSLLELDEENKTMHELYLTDHVKIWYIMIALFCMSLRCVL